MPPIPLLGESFGSDKGGNVAFVLPAIGAMLRGADNRGLNLASSISSLFICGGVGAGTNFCYLTPISGMGVMLTTTVATAGPGRLVFPFEFA